jgi:hypothetical protein
MAAKRIYDNWLEAYLRYTSNTEAPENFNFWVGISTIASAVGRQVLIDQGHFQWVPNFYITMVAKAGLATKSTAIGLGEDLMRATGKIKFAANSSTWQALVEELTESKRANLEVGTPHCTLTVVASELGTFLDLENREQVEFLTEVWDAKRSAWIRRTVGGGDKKQKVIENPCLNLIAATTPVWIRNNYKQNMVGGGFSSRLIMVEGKAKRRYIAYPKHEPQSPGLREMREHLIADLTAMTELNGEMQLSPEAIEWGTTWYRNHHEKPEMRKLVGDQFDGYYARKQTHMHKLAMIMSIACGDSMIVELDHLIAAQDCLYEMERNLNGLMEHTQASGWYAMAKVNILNAIRERGSMDRDELYSEMSTTLSGKDFDRIIADLARGKQISMLATGSGIRVAPKMQAIQGGKK